MEIKQGRILYKMSIVFPKNAPAIKTYSKKLWHQILHYNIPSGKEVFFNGILSRTDTTDVELGYKSPVTILKKSNEKKYRYCKKFPFFNFWVNNTEDLSSTGEYFIEQVELLKEHKKIAGFNCKCAKIIAASKTYIIYYTEALKIKDPTNAALSNKNINGFILQQDEIPVAKDVYYYLRYTVKNFDFKTPVASSKFNIPRSYIHFSNTDKVRAENRRMMNKIFSSKKTPNKFTEKQKTTFNGHWKMDKFKDKIVMKVEYAGSKNKWQNKYTVVTKNFSGEQKAITETALLLGKFLLVEEPPNYRLYSYNSIDDTIQQYHNDIFIFKRLTGRAVQALKF
ncbi:MAG: hypothetical protein ABIO55_03200 [Ginsengibacter sp.]